MTGARKLCLTLKPASERQLDRAIGDALLKKPDFIELRMDGMPIREIPKAVQRVHRVMGRTILTLRSKEEGGDYAGSDSERKEIIESLLAEKFKLLDVEWSFYSRNKKFVGELRDAKIPIIASYHNFYTTPSKRVLQNLFEEMSGVGKVVKIVTMANAPSDNLKIMGLYQDNPKRDDLLAFAMGGYGQMSRIMSITSYNAPFAYCSVGKPVAPGMMGIDEMRSILRAIPRP
ncbi:MAG: type I 3-dehydroquinate dehydratase [Candidatus Micrarchaeota archaeon]|nr:type I 3-dehydroquinate dehydratase [Candidatus Micrarchaeota archaeon]